MVNNWLCLPVVVGMLLFVSCVQAAPVTDGLVAYYDGNLSGNSLVDLSGNNNTGYATNVTSGTNPLTGANYIHLNGVNSKIVVSNNAQTNVSSPISIEFVGSIHEFKQYAALVSKYDEEKSGWYLGCSAQPPYNRIRFCTVLQSGEMGFKTEGSLGVLDADKVYHIVATYDNSTANIYINGTNPGIHAWDSPIIGNPLNITLGSGSGIPDCNCSMYVFRLYNRSLSPDEVLQNYEYDLSRYKVTPTIVWTNPVNITSGTALNETQLNAVANDPVTGNTVNGVFVYTPAAGTVLSVGTHTLHVDFTPTDAVNYTNATADVTISVSGNRFIPTANFTADVTSGPAPLSVEFTDSSENATAWSWNFGDGQTSTVQNPIHKYNSPGTYTVSLNVSNADGYNISTKSNLITVNSTTPLVTDGLVVYYDGSLSGNSLLADLSGNNNTGYATSVTPWTNQLTGADYVNLNGVNSKIDVSNNAQTNVSSPISIEFVGSINEFVKYGALVSKHQNWTTGWYLSSSSAAPYNKARFNAGVESGFKNYESDDSLVAGQVYDIVVTYDNSNISHIYINGEDSGSRSWWNSSILRSSENITIGSGYKLPYCNCSMYTFRLYNRSLSPDEVLQNYKYDRWRIDVPQPPNDNIKMIKKLVYGNGGLPRYMGSHAMSQSGSVINLVDSDMSSLGLVSTPYYQDNGGAQANYTLLNSSISGVKWKNYYAPGSSVSLTFSGNNRTRLESINLSNNSLHLSSSVTYTGETLVTKEAVPVTGNAFQFYGDGLNTISGDTVQAYTDNGLIQSDCLWPNGSAVYSYYQKRTDGTTRNNSIELPLSSPQLTPMPCPSGYLGSLSFAIHADSQDPESLKTIMYGTNDTQNPVYGTKGFFGHGLICTWSAFALSTNSGAGIDNPLFKSTIDEMYAHGFEIVPHNVVAWMGEGYPTRAITAYYLPWYFDNYSSRNWIDHGLGGGNRCTSLKRLGLDKTSEYYVGDLLRQYGIQYAWSYHYIPISGGLSTSRIQSLGLPYDVVWTNTNFTWDDGTPMYEWASTVTGDAHSLEYFNNNTLQTMIDSYGVCFWHDYPAQNDSTFENYYYTKGNPNMINPTYDNLLQNISEQRATGKLWNPTVSQYIDYWRAACNVECKCTGQNTYTLINHNSTTINGYAMRVTGPYTYTVKLDGNSLNTKKNGADTVFWMDLSPGEHLLTLVGA
jgi:PKD repeat protein